MISFSRSAMFFFHFFHAVHCLLAHLFEWDYASTQNLFWYPRIRTVFALAGYQNSQDTSNTCKCQLIYTSVIIAIRMDKHLNH